MIGQHVRSRDKGVRGLGVPELNAFGFRCVEGGKIPVVFLKDIRGVIEALRPLVAGAAFSRRLFSDEVFAEGAGQNGGQENQIAEHRYQEDRQHHLAEHLRRRKRTEGKG